MITQAHFTELVRTEYLFLEKKYGFSYVRAESTRRQIFVYYRKEALVVAVKYSYANCYIEVSIYNDVPEVLPSLEQIYLLESNVMLIHLLHRENPNFDYLSVMPKVIPLEESVKQTAALLKYYGDSILSGEEWVTWQEITRYIQ